MGGIILKKSYLTQADALILILTCQKHAIAQDEYHRFPPENPVVRDDHSQSNNDGTVDSAVAC
jgi:hypothetical protein